MPKFDFSGKKTRKRARKHQENKSTDTDTAQLAYAACSGNPSHP